MTATERSLLLSMCSLADDRSTEDGVHVCGGNIYPSQEYLADLSFVEKRTITRGLKSLEEKGWIRKHPTDRYRAWASRQSGRKPVCYQINLTLLAYHLDIMHTMSHRIARERESLYQELVELAYLLAQSRWDDNVWSKTYVPKRLSISDGVSPELWGADSPDRVDSGGELISQEEIQYQDPPDTESNDNGYVPILLPKIK